MSKKVISLLKKKIMEDKFKPAAKPAGTGSNVEAPQITGTPLDTKNVPGGKPVELSTAAVNYETLNMMHVSAMENSTNAKEDGYNIEVSPVDVIEIDGNTSFKAFTITDLDNETGQSDYAIYQIDDMIYYRSVKEFKQLVQDIQDRMPGIDIESFKHSYANVKEPLDTSYSIVDRDDCAFVICSIFSAITGKSYDNALIIDRVVDESCKIRKNNKLGTDGIFKKSIKAHDAKYGSADEVAFKQELEDKQKKDGTVGALDQQQQQENEQPKIPNVHRKMMSERLVGVDVDALLEAKSDEIYYEPHDRVVIVTKSGEIPGMVTAVYDNVDQSQLLTVMCQGSTVNVTSKEVKPDMSYLVNQLADYTDEFNDIAFQIDKTTRLNKKAENDKKDYSKEHKDLNGKSVECDIILNGFKVNFEKHYASLKDISESSKYVKVVNESGVEDMWPMESISIDEENWPYAVIVRPEDEDNEPVRKIRIDPKSYVDATDDDLVDCLMNGEHTQIAKKNIKIIS